MIPPFVFEHLAQLTDPANWSDNPFARREAARDAKRKQPYKSLLWMLALVTPCFALAMWGLFTYRAQGRGVPWFLGGTFGTALCLSFAWIHALFVSGSSYKHTSVLILQEANRNTLPGLLTLPTPAFQLLVQAAVYPWLAAMRMALAGLPFYVFCVAMGGLSWLDVLMLYVVLSGMALTLPIWMRPILADSVAFSVPLPGKPGTGPVPGTATAGTATPAVQTSTGGTGAGAGGVGFFFVFIVLLFTLTSALRGGSSPAAIYQSLHRYAPDSLVQLLPTVFVSWPLLIARTLITPLDWFGIPLPPLLFAPFTFLLSRYLTVVRSAEYLRVGTYRDLALQPTYEPWQRLLKTLRTFQILLWTGYLWKWAIPGGGLTQFLPSPASSLANFFWLLLFVTAWRGMLRAGAVGGWIRESGQAEKEKKSRGEESPESLSAPSSPAVELAVRQVERGTAWRYVLEPYLFALVYALVCCLLSRTMPFTAEILPLAGRMLLIGAAGAVLSYGTQRLFPRSFMLGLVIPGAALFGPPAVRSLLYLSPTMGLLSFASLDFLRGVVPPGYVVPGLNDWIQKTPPVYVWWGWLASGVFGVLLVGIALLFRRRAAAGVSPPALLLDPTRFGTEVFFDGMMTERTAQTRKESPLATRLVTAIQRLSDNAVMVKEMRARLRGRLSALELRTTFVLFLLVTVGLLSVPGISQNFGGFLSGILFGNLTAPTAQTEAGTLGCWFVAMIYTGVSIGLNVAPNAFAPEREKATLGFVLLSPMRGMAIVAGKAAGLLASGGLTLGAMAFWSLGLSLVFSPTLGLKESLFAWSAILLTALTLAWTLAMLSLALAALLPKLINQAGCGALLYVVLIQVPFQLLVQFGRRNAYGGWFGFLSDWDSGSLWFGMFIVCLLLSALFLLLATWGVARMRRGNIAFESSRREN